MQGSCCQKFVYLSCVYFPVFCCNIKVNFQVFQSWLESPLNPIQNGYNWRGQKCQMRTESSKEASAQAMASNNNNGKEKKEVMQSNLPLLFANGSPISLESLNLVREIWLHSWATRLFLSKLVQTCPNSSKLVQTCPNLSKLVQTYPKLVQTYPKLAWKHICLQIIYSDLYILLLLI